MTATQTSGDVPELGLCWVRTPSLATERVLGRFYEGPQADATSYIDALISHVSVSPSLSYDDVSALPPATRWGLRALVAEACALETTSAADDRSLLSAMRERYRQLASKSVTTQEGLLAWANDKLSEMRERAHEAARGPDIESVLRAWAQTLSDRGEQARQIIAFYEQQPLGFVVRDVNLDASAGLLFDAAEHGDHVMVAALDAGLIDNDFADMVAAQLTEAVELDASQQYELQDGIELLLKRRYASSCRLLMGAVEGLVWDLALREAVINDQQELLKSARPTRRALRRAKSVNNLLDERVGVELDPDFRLFLRDALWNKQGHDLRHGRRRGSERSFALWSLVALCGLLDRRSHRHLTLEIGNRIDAYVSPIR